MTDARPSAQDYALLFTLALLWGTSFMIIKIAVETVPPFTLTAARLAIAAVLLCVAARVSGQSLPKTGKAWILVTLAAIFSNALPFTLISWGEEKIDSGLTAILMAVMPLTTVLLAHFLIQDEKLTLRKLIGVSMGIVGIVILIGPDKLAHLGEETIRQLAVAGAAFCYGIGAIIAKHLMTENRRGTIAGIMLVAAGLQIPASLVVDHPWTLDPTTISIVAVLVLGVIQTALANILMFAIIRRQGAAFFSQINLLIPIIGVFGGAMILAERPTSNAYVALAVILAGILIARGWKQRAKTA